MATDMTRINSMINGFLKENGFEPTIDNRVEALASVAKQIAHEETLDIHLRAEIALDISVEIVRLRQEKLMFGL